MSFARIVVFASVLVAFAELNGRTVLAQESVIDPHTEFTFNEPVELPGVTLQPGTYVFRFADANSSRKVMEVVAKERRRKTYGLFATAMVRRARPADHAEVRFMETPADTNQAVRTWWYPGNSIGREFIYPKSQARRLAMLTRSRVLTTKAENVSNGDMQKASLSYVSPSGEESPVTDDRG